MQTPIRFLLGGQVQEVVVTDTTLTLLDWLRGSARRPGTKEGCAEGDCGACTVAIGTLAGDSVTYQAVNACIQFLPMLDGKQVVTVEDLATSDADLHPVQQAMVTEHASQCGFCTPGFVMSLYTLYQTHDTAPAREEINTALAGNLCRCTGYKPIIAAAASMFSLPRPAVEPPVTLLKQIQRNTALSITTETGQRFDAPITLDELADLIERFPQAELLAGATDIGLWVTKQHRPMPHLISVGAVAALKEITQTPEAITFGAGVSFTEALPHLAAIHPDLERLFKRIGSAQIRNSGTLGGNIGNGSPIGDSMPALIALGATVTLRKGAVERTLPLEDYFLDYRKTARQAGEFIVSVSVSRLDTKSHYGTDKISKRIDQDISAVCGAYRLELEDGIIAAARLGFGGMAGIPARAPAAEAALRGKPFDEAAIRGAMAALSEDFSPLSDMRASASYRLTVARNLLLRFYLRETGVLVQEAAE
ncbi:MAG: xanthine dehydrogenase small subunit [Elstera sp.]